MGMRVFFAFLIVAISAILFMLPITEAVYDFRTELRTDDFSVITTDGLSTTNVTLLRNIYEDDTTTLEFLSSISSDSPAFSSYNATNRDLEISGLAGNTSRTMYVSYDIDALEASNAINNFISIFPFIWMICWIVFPIGSLYALFMM